MNGKQFPIQVQEFAHLYPPAESGKWDSKEHFYTPEAMATRLIRYHIDVFKYHNLWLNNCINGKRILPFTSEFSEAKAFSPENTQRHLPGILKGIIMKKSAVLSVLTLGILGALSALPAFADDVYNNFGSGSLTSTTTIAGTEMNPGLIISYGGAITDSFTLCCTGIKGVFFPVWVPSEDTVSSIDWAITTEPFGGSTVASGTASSLPNHYISSISLGDDEDDFDILGEYISFKPDLLSCCGTYWLQLSNAVATDSDPVWWDESDGKSTAYQIFPEEDDPPIPSESFKILGSQVDCTPEPSSFLLLGSGLAGLAGLIKRKLAA